MVGRGGFEPPKSVTADLQSAPFALNTWLAEDGNHSTAHAIPLSSQARRLGLDATRRCLWSGKVAQPARRVKDKRLRRAFGILDAAR